jgi:hypothetical protein
MVRIYKKGKNREIKKDDSSSLARGMAEAVV